MEQDLKKKKKALTVDMMGSKWQVHFSTSLRRLYMEEGTKI